MANYKVAHLTRRGDLFHFRLAIPRQLAARLGQRELKLSLRTSDPLLARIRSRLLSNLIEQLFATVAFMPELTPDTIKVLVQQYFAEALAEVTEISLLGPTDSKFDIEAEIAGAKQDEAELKRKIGRRAYDAVVLSHARKLLERHGFTPPPGMTDAFDALCNGVLRAEAERRRILVALLRGDMQNSRPVDPLFDGILPGALPPLPGDHESTLGDTVGTVAERYRTTKIKSKEWVGKTANENRRVLDLFCELVGSSKPMKAIAEEDIRCFRDALLTVPPNYVKLKEFAGMPLAKVLLACKASDQALAPKTAKKYLANLRTFLLWATDEGYIPKAPGGKVKIKAKLSAQGARHPFSQEQLKKLFSSPQFTGHLSATTRSKPGKLLIRDGRYWVPLVGLFTGMRLGEIVQLLTSDLKKDQGVWYFDVAWGDGEDKHLKTASSKRVIPLHPTLEKLGFLDLVEQRRKQDPSSRIFAEIEKGEDGYFSHNFSKWFTRYSRQIGIKTTKTSFHSFRHNFKDALVLGHVEDTHIKALLGHADNSTTAGYGTKLQPQTLFPDVCKIEYDLPEPLFEKDHELL